MSLFQTKLPIDFKAFSDSLPQGAYIHSITLDKKYHPESQKEPPQCVVIEWESHKLNTGYTFPVEYPLNDLKKGRLSASLKSLLDKAKAVFAKPEVKIVSRAISAPKNTIPDPQLRTVEEFDKAKAEGKLMEYQGIEPRWLAVEKDHQFTEGFYYRVKAEPESPKVEQPVYEGIPADVA